MVNFPGNEYTRTFAIHAKAKRSKAFRSSATIQTTRVFWAQGEHGKYYRRDRKDWHTNSVPLPKELDPIEGKNTIRYLNGRDSAELNQSFYNGSFSYFNRLSFQVQTEKETSVLHCNQSEYCTYWCIHISTKEFKPDY